MVRMRCNVHSSAANRGRALWWGFAGAVVFVAAALLACLCHSTCAWAAPSVSEGAQVASSSGEAEASTTVSVYMDAFRILGQTPDLAGSADELLNGPGSLRATVAGGIAPYYYSWTRTIDGVGDTSFSDVGNIADTSSPVVHEFAAGELAEGHDYEYVLSVVDSDGGTPQKVEARIRVLCSGDYGWRDGADDVDEELGDDGYPQVSEPLYFHDEITNADIKVAGYLHRSARIIVTPLDDYDPARLALEVAAGTARVTGAWVIEVVFEGGPPEGDVDPFVGDVHVSVRFPGQEEVRVASTNAKVDGLRASVRVGETWSFPESVLFVGPDALTQRPDCEIDDAREWLSFATNMLGAFATLGEKVPGSGHEITLDVRGAGSVVPAPTDGARAWQVADGGMQRAVLLPDAGYMIGEVRASNGVSVSVSGNRLLVGPVDADCTLTVTFDKVEPDPTVAHTLSTEVVGGHGAVEPAEPVEVMHGQSALVQFLPDAGYVVDKVLVNGLEVTSFADVYLVPALTEDVHVAVSYRQGTPAPQTWFSATAKVKAGEGAVSPNAAMVQLGGRATFSFLPAEGWQVADVLVNGESVGAPVSWTVENVTADVLVEVSFTQGEVPGPGPDNPDDPNNPDKPATYKVQASAGSHGRISPDGEVAVVEGADATFSFAADTGFRVADVTVDGVSVGAPSSYTFHDVRASHSIHAEFQPVHDNAGGGGSGGGGTGNQQGSGTLAPVKTGDMVGLAVLGLLVLAALAAPVVVVARRRSRRR